MGSRFSAILAIPRFAAAGADKPAVPPKAPARVRTAATAQPAPRHADGPALERSGPDARPALGVDHREISETSRGKLDATGTDDASWRRDRRVDIALQ
jgi:hypothetical protein